MMADFLKKIDQLLIHAGSDSKKREQFLKKLESQDIKSLTIAKVALAVGSILGIEDNTNLVDKITALINKSKVVYCLVQLEQLQIFASKKDATREITTLQKKRTKEDYYTGQFQHIAEEVYLFKYEVTERANNAVRADFHLVIDEVDIDDVFPNLAPLLFTLDVKIYCVPRSYLDLIKEEGRAEGKAEGWAEGMEKGS